MGFFSKHKEQDTAHKPGQARASGSGSAAATSAAKSAVSDHTPAEPHHQPAQEAETDEATGSASHLAAADGGLAAEDAEVPEKKVFTKEKAPAGDGFEVQMGDSEAETETFINTKLNALLYHTSDDSIDRYKSENTSSDLLGRLYYDDYDASNRSAVASLSSLAPVTSPLRSGVVSPVSRPQFAVGAEPEELPLSAESTASKRPVRPSFASQVSFDTLSDFHHQAITLKAKHPEFKFRRNNKCFLIGFNNDAESFKAVEWAFLEMVVHGDTIIVLHVLDSKTSRGLDRAMAEATFEKIKGLNTHRRKISIVFESVIGQPQKLLKQAIAEYKPAMMIVGTSHYGQSPGPSSHGNSSTNLHQQSRLHMPFFSKTSISKYFLQFALVPVILVKPFYEIHEQLDRPVSGEEYFSQWLASIDVTHTYEKKKRFLAMRSPPASRSSSHTSLVDLESRGRSDRFTVGSRDSSASRSLSRSARPDSLSARRSRDKDRLQEDERARSRSRSRLSRIFSN